MDVVCHRCQRKIPEEDSFGFFGEVLCDDCYMDARAPAKACDPWAVYLATRTRETSGLTGVEGLSPLQKEVYEFIKKNGRVKPVEEMNKFNISQRGLEQTVATLRHCEMVRGEKDGNNIYLVPF